MNPAVGVDYSATQVYLTVVNEEVMASITLILPTDDSGKLAFFQNVIEVLESWDNEFGLPYLWIEQPFVNGKFPRPGMLIQRMATFLEIASLQALISPVFVHPGTWRKRLFDNGKPKDAKERAIAHVEEVLHYELPTLGKTARAKNKDHNFADSACIAHYGHLMQKENSVFNSSGEEIWSLDNPKTG